MSDTPDPADPTTQAAAASPTMPSPLRCLVGSVISGGFAFALYTLTASIAHTFATKPLQSDNFTAQRIAAAVRTLVVGLSTLGTGIFALATLGLLALGIQLLVRGQSAPPADS